MGELTAGGRPRRFALHLPRTGSGGGIPLVIVLHGNHQDATGQMMRDWTTFDEQAGAFGFAVAYPDGIGGCWADGRGVTTADEEGVDDVAFLRALIDTMADRHGTHPDRTVVAGVSNGAFMATGSRSRRARRWRCSPPSRAACRPACVTRGPRMRCRRC